MPRHATTTVALPLVAVSVLHAGAFTVGALAAATWLPFLLVGRALGATPLCQDAGHARRTADLTVYLRQSHAGADLARLGELVAAGGDNRW